MNSLNTLMIFIIYCSALEASGKKNISNKKCDRVWVTLQENKNITTLSITG